MNISIYIPCYTAEKHLTQVLTAVMKLTLTPSEVIVVNDSSTDKTMDIARMFPVKIIEHESNKGLAAARNTARGCAHRVAPYAIRFAACLDSRQDCYGSQAAFGRARRVSQERVRGSADAAEIVRGRATCVPRSHRVTNYSLSVLPLPPFGSPRC
mgnify:CR=1 FL=1